MRFNNDDYLNAFPREDRAAATEKTVVKDEPGDVFDQDEKTPAGDPEITETESAGGEEVGNE